MYYLDPAAASYANPCQQIPNPSVAALYEDALVYETGSAITSSGALTAYSGAKTGRSPLDKRVVKEPSSENDIWVRFLSPVLYITLLTGVTVGSCQQAHDS
jgi:ATP-dependent phosphoenolpyruvate carboxykinase